MKKVFYSIAIISAMMFASCSEDRGRTHEVADANQDENVNPSHIRGYGDDETAADMAMRPGTMGQSGDMAQRNTPEQISAQMAQDLQLTPETQTRVQKVLVEREKRLAELEGNYNYSETNRMGGQVAEDVDNTATRDRNKIDRDGGTATDMRANSAESMNDEMELVTADTERELRTVLTPEQYMKYEQNKVTYFGANTNLTNPGNNTENAGSNQNNMNNAGQDGMNNSTQDNMNNSGTNRTNMNNSGTKQNNNQ